MPIQSAEIAALSRLLDQALPLSAAEREAWLAALPPEDRPYADRLRRMLAPRDETRTVPHPHSGSSGDFAELPLLDADDDDTARVGERVGPYRLLKPIGHGGMGSVWLAERADGSFQRRVALKLPRLAWGAGLAARMALEREIGMRLEHPNIARLYDAGVDQGGRPYLALEYVDGQPIDAWCTAQALGVPARLRLFLQVVRAVAHAHGRLVVHRDMKPSNVLVSADGQAHLLDFGIAKLLSEAADEDGLTQQQGRLLTPQYAAPEQILGETITVMTDIYSLGALLYLLLTGSLPHAANRRGPAALEQAVLDEEPPLASTRVRDRAIAKSLRGELDAILAKALRRAPGQRYATADALAQDIERHLAGERVLAQPDSLGYRVHKLLRRHRLGVATGAAIAVAVLGGASASMVQAKRASDAAQRANVVKEFVVDIFKVNERGNPANNELRQLPVELLLERGAKLIETRFAGQLGLQAELYGVVARIMLDMGADQQAVAYAAKHVASSEAARVPALARAEAALLMGEALRGSFRYAEAEARAREAQDLATDSLGLRLQAALLRVELALDTRRHELAGQMLAEVDAALARDPSAVPMSRLRAAHLRARMLSETNHFDQARPFFEQAIDAALAAEGDASRLAARIRRDYASQLMTRRHQESASEMFALAVGAMRASGGPDDLEALLTEADAAFQAASCGCENGNYARVDGVIAKGLETVDRLGPRVPAAVRARLESQRGCLAVQTGRVEQGYRLVERSTALLRPAAPETLAGECLGQAAMETGHHDEAETENQLQLAYAERNPAGTQFARVSRHVLLAENRIMQGQLDAARQALDSAPRPSPVEGALPDAAFWQATLLRLAQARVDIAAHDPDAALRRLDGLNDRQYPVIDSWLIRGIAMCRLGRPGDGLPFMLQGLIWLEARKPFPDDPGAAFWRARAGLCALDAGEPGKARELAGLAAGAFARQPGVAAYYKSPLEALQARLSNVPPAPQRRSAHGNEPGSRTAATTPPAR